ncbi:MAG: Maf family protein [Candidatus Omnitrophica bacterium]|nr:Maf family protein [Candidatus Omnitrophota bacterium]
MTPIILASASPRRKELLLRTGLPIRVQPSTIHEPATTRLSPECFALSLALRKADNVAATVNRGIVIGADTIVVLDGKIFGKPVNAAHARKILSALSNTRHYVYTAIAVIDTATRRRIVDIDKTTVITRKIPPRVIDALALKNHDKAGAYAVQEDGDAIIKHIKGDFYNVVGLPLGKLREILRIFGIVLKTL